MSRIDDEHPRDQISRVSLNRFPHLVATRTDLAQQDGYVVVVEGKHSTDEGVEDDSSRPNIRRRSIVFRALIFCSAGVDEEIEERTVMTSGLA